MFSVFHTADWHLGQSFCGYDRDYEHRQFLDWLLTALQQHRPEALLIAGDVFDTINPSAIAQRRFFDFLANIRFKLPSLQIVITAGNHDSAARLEAPAGLLESLRIKVVGTIQRDSADEIDLSRFLVTLTDTNGSPKAIVLAIPFLRPSDVPLIPSAADPYLDGVRELYRQTTAAAVSLRQELAADIPLIAMGHCHVMGGAESTDSERRIVIGGAEALGLDIFLQDLSYVALGHLHKAQQFQDGRICYSGSPIPLSFSEAGYRHRLLKLLFDRQSLATVEEVPVPRTVPLISVPQGGAAKIDDVLSQITEIEFQADTAHEQQPFLEVRVIDDGPDPSRRKRIEDAVQHLPVRLASIKMESSARSSTASSDDRLPTLADLRSINPEEIFANTFMEKFQREPDDSLLAAFREILSQQESHAS